MEATEQQIEHAKNVEIKMRKVFRRTSETIPLHFKPKYESFGFKEEEENEQNNNKKSDNKISHFNSSQIIHPIFSPRESRRSFVNTIVSNGEHISTPTALNALKENLFSFGSPKSSTSPSRKLKIFLPASSETSETKSTPHTPNSYSAGLVPKSKLSKLISQKSSFSGVSQEKLQEDQVPSARNHLRESSLFSNKKKDTEENTPTSFTNTFSPRSDKIQDPSRLLSGSRRFQSIFASAFQSTPQTSPRKTLKSNRSEEKLVHNIHIAAKVEQDKAMKLNKMRPSFAKIKTRGFMTERRKSEDVPRLEPLHLSKPFENEVNLDIKQIKNLDNLGEFKEFIIRKGVHGQELKKQRNRPQLMMTKNN